MVAVADQDYVVSQFFVHWKIYSAINDGTYFNFYFSDANRRITLSGQEYTPLDRFVQISSTRSSIVSDGDGVSVSITQTDRNGNNDLTLNFSLYALRYSEMTIRRGLFDTNGELLDLTDGTSSINPRIKYKGLVNNYSIQELVDPISGKGSVNITMNLIDYKTFWARRTNGRKTRRSDALNGGIEFNRVQTLKNQPIEWGDA